VKQPIRKKLEKFQKNHKKS